MKSTVFSIKKTAGLTLLELMITVAILSILLTAVGPNIQSMLTTNRIAADVNMLSSVMRFARHTAVNEQAQVTICPTIDFDSCSNDWNDSKMVFIDTNGNGQRDATEELLAAGDPVNNSNSLSGTTAPVQFDPDGSTTNALTLKLCPSSNDDEFARALLVTQFGRISVSVDSDGDGTAEDGAGNELSCP